MDKGKLVPLSISHPQIASEAFGWSPEDVSAGSIKKLAWRCSTGHVFYTSANNRTKKSKNPEQQRKSNGCPYCSNKLILVGYNDLETTHPDLAKQADGWDPKEVSAGSSRRLSWVCDANHKWNVSVYSRTQSPYCPYCSGHRVVKGVNDFATVYPDLLKYVDGWDPTEVKPYSNIRVNWKCALGHTWNVTLGSITSKYTPGKQICPYCINQRVLFGFNDLLTTHPDLAKQANGWDPKKVIAGSNHKRRWKCNLGHSWEAQVNSRTKKTKATGCPYCAHQRVWRGFNDLASQNPELAKQADGWDPSLVMVSSKGKYPWVCEKNHRWQSLLSNRSKGAGCPYCSNQKILIGFNDLKTLKPEIAKEANGWDPTEVSIGSPKYRSWICGLGHTYQASPWQRKEGSGCPFCSSHQVLIGFNDLQTINPVLAREADGWDPTTVTSKSSKRRKWRCENSHTWIQSVSIRASGVGCPTCAKTGYDPNKDGYLYFLRHETWGMLQIGITNNLKSRITKHKRKGWEVLEIRGPMDGHLVQDWETSILRMLRSINSGLANDKVAGKFDGYSEAWSQERLPVSSISQLMRMTEQFENSEGIEESV